MSNRLARSRRAFALFFLLATSCADDTVGGVGGAGASPGTGGTASTGGSGTGGSGTGGSAGGGGDACFAVGELCDPDNPDSANPVNCCSGACELSSATNTALCVEPSGDGGRL